MLHGVLWGGEVRRVAWIRAGMRRDAQDCVGVRRACAGHAQDCVICIV